MYKIWKGIAIIFGVVLTYLTGVGTVIGAIIYLVGKSNSESSNNRNNKVSYARDYRTRY